MSLFYTICHLYYTFKCHSKEGEKQPGTSLIPSTRFKSRQDQIVTFESERVVVGVLNQEHLICRLPNQDQPDQLVKYKDFIGNIYLFPVRFDCSS